MRIDNSSPGPAFDNPQEIQSLDTSSLQDAANVLANALNDRGAVDTIEQLKGDEAGEDYGVECNEQGMMMLVPTGNQLTGPELSGYVLQGTMDKGNEINELQQFAALRGQMGDKLDPAAQRVLDVVDKWVAILQADCKTEMTPEQKAQFASELADAARPRERDYATVADPLPFPPVEISPFPGEVIVNTLPEIVEAPLTGPADPNAANTGSLANLLRPEGEPGPNGLPYPYK